MQGLINEAQVDSFNLPLYVVSPKEMIEIVEGNGCFSVEIMELYKPMASIDDDKITAQSVTMHLRAAMEAIISKHFGAGIIDELFKRCHKKIDEFSDKLHQRYKEGTQLFIVLKRK